MTLNALRPRFHDGVPRNGVHRDPCLARHHPHDAGGGRRLAVGRNADVAVKHVGEDLLLQRMPDAAADGCQQRARKLRRIQIVPDGEGNTFHDGQRQRAGVAGLFEAEERTAHVAILNGARSPPR